MITSNDFRPGVTIEIDGQVWQVVEFQHVKPGKGAAFVRAKIKTSKPVPLSNAHGMPAKRFRTATSTAARCSIFMKMKACTVSWITKRMNRLN